MSFQYTRLAEKPANSRAIDNDDIEDDESAEYEPRAEIARQHRTHRLHWTCHAITAIVIALLTVRVFWQEKVARTPGTCQAHIPCKWLYLFLEVLRD
jgi:hypothetical protein